MKIAILIEITAPCSLGDVLESIDNALNPDFGAEITQLHPLYHVDRNKTYVDQRREESSED